MKIIHLSNSFDALSQTFVRYFTEKSSTFSSNLLVSVQLEDELANQDLPQIYYDRTKTREFLHYLQDKFSSSTRRQKKWDQLLAEFRPQIIHCHFGEMGNLANELLKSGDFKIPLVVSFYGFDAFQLPRENAQYLKKLKCLFENTAAYFFAEGPHLKKQLVSLGAKEERVLINPLIVSLDQTAKRKVPWHKLKLLMIGRFVEKKGFHLALEVLGQIKDRLPDFEVSIIGFGEMEDHYRMIIHKYGIDDKVFFLGKQSHEEVKNALVEHDFFIHPSLTAQNGDSEGGAPTIIIEAQAAGLAVIASKHADIPYVMGYDDFLAEENNLDDLKRCIFLAVNSSNVDELVENGKRHVEQQHDFVQSTQYESNIRQIIHNFEVNR